MSERVDSTKEELAKELEKLASSKNSFKEYYLSMKEMSEWLKEREK
ncbi:MAG: hypothetical protein U9Q40_07455 [Campylobacterota bacterium]|nr:hypothetical protein [Campylobacterota bacterium]